MNLNAFYLFPKRPSLTFSRVHMMLYTCRPSIAAGGRKTLDSREFVKKKRKGQKHAPYRFGDMIIFGVL
jgi:hypothetical protein